MQPEHALAPFAPPLATLLEGLVDYAGLFPPAALPMAEAVREYALIRAGDDARWLGRFVVPAARLEDFEPQAAPLLPPVPSAGWLLSALAGTDVAEAVRLVDAFNARHAAEGAPACQVDVLEWKAASHAEIEAVVPALPAELTSYVEIPLADDPRPFLAALRATGARAKVRTGGVTADAFPEAARLARFIREAVALGVPFKATAGLHHPLRGEYRLTYEPGSPRGTMFGYLNLFLASALAAQGAPEATVAALLDERDPAAFTIAADHLAWRGRAISVAELGRLRREVAIAFGSCSFREPVDELRALPFA